MKLPDKINEESSDTEKINEINTADMANSFSDEELANVVGGIRAKRETENPSSFMCPICQGKIAIDLHMYVYSSYIICPTCKTTLPIEHGSMAGKLSEIWDRIKG